MHNGISGVRMKILLFVLALLWSGASESATRYATRVVVDKSRRELYVYVDQKIVATYPVALGINPVGRKQREGDQRTPEGSYVLDFKNVHSAYFRAIHVSYPNREDMAAAKKLGFRPGGAIMIHGQPNNAAVQMAVKLYPSRDWTDGCIALSNSDMQLLWDAIRVPIPIEINP
jgi:murein L,D-transpeptidase YafK